LCQQLAAGGTLGAASRQGGEEGGGMASEPGGYRGWRLALLPAVVNQLADEAAAIQAALLLQLPQATLRVWIEAHGEGHGKRRHTAKA